MSQKKKILFVLPFNPYPLSTGGSQAIFNGIDVVKDDLDVYVTFEATATDKDNIERLKSLLDNKVTVLPYFVPAPKSTKRDLKQRFYEPLFKTEKKLRRLAGYDFTPVRIPHRAWLHEELLPKKLAFVKHVSNLVDGYNIDIVQCEMLCNVTMGLMLPDRVRKVFVHHELGWVVHELELLKQKGDPFEQKLYLDYYKMCEVALLNCYDDIITLSEIDSKKLKEAGVTSQIHTSLAVVNTSQNQLVTTKGCQLLSFVGPEYNLPNVDGLKWFFANVWDKLKSYDASYRMQVIGKWSEKTIAETVGERSDVEFLGYVDDLAAVLKDTIMVVPINIGSGIRMKILEAAALGVPFVTTSVGVEGIPARNGEDCFIADTPEAFADAVVKLRDEKLRKQFAENANRLVSERYTLEALKANRLEIYREM